MIIGFLRRGVVRKDDIIAEMHEKIKSLKTPKHFSFRPVLIYVTGASDHVKESTTFSHIINFDEFLTD